MIIKSRLVLYPKDVARILGISVRSARIKCKCVKLKYGKTQEQLLSVKEFAEYYGLDVNDVEKQLV